VKAIQRKLAAAWIVAFVGVATLASAQPRKEIREDKKEVREDRKEKREDRKELHDDKKELHEDRKDGASKDELKDDKKEIREDKKELREDRKEIREDLRAKREDHRKALREKWGPLAKRADGREELRVHARRMARLEHAKKVATDAKKPAVVTRIDKLIEKENARHQRVMDRLKAQPPAGGTP
jgi:predicted nuclease with TOPRIM domain